MELANYRFKHRNSTEMKVLMQKTSSLINNSDKCLFESPVQGPAPVRSRLSIEFTCKDVAELVASERSSEREEIECR